MLKSRSTTAAMLLVARMASQVRKQAQAPVEPSVAAALYAPRRRDPTEAMHALRAPGRADAH